MVVESCISSFHNGFYQQAYDHCLEGRHAAHSAFFDETMLPLLYFPDEHVYAVYLPYFAPIFMPVLSRVVQFLKSLRSSKTKRD